MPMPTRTHHSRRHLVRPPSKQILQLREDSDFVSSPFPSTSSSSSWRNTTDGATQHLDGPAERNSGEEDDGCSGVGGGGNTVAGSNSIGDAAVRRAHTTQRSHDLASLRDTTDGASIHTSNQHDGAGGDAADASSTRRRIQHTTQRAMTASAARRGGHSAHRGRKEGGGSISSGSHHLHQRRSSSNTGEFSHGGPYAYGAAPAVSGGHVTYYGSPSNRLPPATASLSPAASPSSSLSVTDKSALHTASSNGSSRELLTAAHSERRLSTFTSSGSGGGGGDGGRRSGVSVVSHSSPSSGEMSCGDAGTAPPTPPGANTFSTEAPGDFEPCRRSDTTPTHGRGSARTTPSDAVKATTRGGDGGGGGFGTRDGSPASTRGFSGLVTAANALHRASPASLAPDHTSASSISMTNNNSTAALGTFPRHADTPLTYAAVASTPSSTAGSSSLHGKRLPQSRVGFGNYRKRASTASVSSTVCSTIGTPATAGTPLFLNEAASGSSLAGGRPGSVNGCHGGVGGGGGSSSAAVDGVWGFPSVPLTPRTVTTASGSNRTAATTRTTTTTTSNTSRATAPNSPPSPAPLILANDDGAEERVAGGGGDKDGEREVEDGGDRRGWSAGDAVDGQEGCQSMPSTRRPPIPLSLHRHQPTNFFLQLPPGHGQQPDSDEEDGCCCGGDSGGQAEGGEGRQRSSSNLTTTTAAVNGMMAASTQPQQQQPSPRSPAPLSPTAQRQQSAIIEEELRRCHTSSTHTHTGPAVAAKAAAGLQLQPLKMSFDGSIASSAAASSAIQTPAAPTVQRPSPQPQQASSLSFTAQQQQTAAASVKAVAAMQAALSYNDDEIGEATPTGPAPPTMANVRVGASSRGGQLPKSNSTACFFNAVEIIPGLFLGAYSDATDTEVLAAHGISLVVNCSLECPVTPAMAHNAHHVRYVQCPLRDHSDEAIAPFFPAVTQIIHEQLHRRQINQQRVQRRHSTAAATTPAARLLATFPAATAAAPPHQQLQLSGRRNSTGEEESGAGESLQDGMVWTWADEAENVWAVPPSPASPPLSVGGQPSLKEGKRETPRTPSSALGCWVRGSDGSASGCTSGSPSPLPGRATTFPKTAAPNAAMDAVPAKAGFGSSYSTTTIHNNSNASNTSNSAAAGVVVNAVTPATTALTVVDPRDCGGVLVHCRMGVSRSATFVMAYLILYGYTLATLEDTASLFVGFLERERCIIEEAGGRARFSLEGSDASGNASCGGCLKTATTTAAATAAPATSATASAGLRTPNNNSSSNNNTSATATSVFGQSGGRVGARVVSPTGTASTASHNGAPTPNSSPLGVRGLLNGFASWYQQRSTSNNNNNNASTVSGGSTTSGVGSSSSCYGSPLAASQRRSNAVPVGSPLFLGVGATTASPRSVSSASHQRLYSLQTPLETCSRVCRACHLQRLRERRLQQQARLGLLLNSHLHHPHHQHRQVLQTQAEKDEEEEQRMALAAVARGRAAQAGTLQGDRSAFGGDVATTEDGRTLRFVGAEEFDEEGNEEEENDNNDDNVDDDDGEEDREEEEGRPLSSSAPVMSYRSARSGTYDFGRRSLLEAARIADDEVYKGEMEEEDDGPLNGGSLEDDTQRLETPTAAMASNNETPPPPPPASSSAAAGGGDSVQPWRNSFSVSKTSASAAAAAVPLAAQGDGLAGPRGLETLTPAEVASVVAAGGRSGRQGGGFGLNGCCDNSSMTSSHSVLSADLAPAMTFREAFDAVKMEKSDVNPNIGFVLALRELAGGGDFSFSTSL